MKSEFNVGDRVRYIGGARHQLVGHLATVVEVRHRDYIVVEFDDEFAFCDTENGMCKPNRGYSLGDVNIDLVEHKSEKMPEINFSFDDLIGGAHNA